MTTRIVVTGNYMEKFLFYRGVGNFDLPVKMQSLGEGKFYVTNTGRDPIHAAFLVQVNDGKVRFTHMGKIAKEATVILSAEPQTLETLADAMVKDLAADGLYEKEARAMVNTWRDSWFTEEGTRVLYILPRAWTDGILPMKLTPEPAQLTRVMVGRAEIISPGVPAHLRALLDRAAAQVAVRLGRGSGRGRPVLWSPRPKRP